MISSEQFAREKHQRILAEMHKNTQELSHENRREVLYEKIQKKVQILRDFFTEIFKLENESDEIIDENFEKNINILREKIDPKINQTVLEKMIASKKQNYLPVFTEDEEFAISLTRIIVQLKKKRDEVKKLQRNPQYAIEAASDFVKNQDLSEENVTIIFCGFSVIFLIKRGFEIEKNDSTGWHHAGSPFVFAFEDTSENVEETIHHEQLHNYLDGHIAPKDPEEMVQRLFSSLIETRENILKDPKKTEISVEEHIKEYEGAFIEQLPRRIMNDVKNEILAEIENATNKTSVSRDKFVYKHLGTAGEQVESTINVLKKGSDELSEKINKLLQQAGQELEKIFIETVVSLKKSLEIGEKIHENALKDVMILAIIYPPEKWWKISKFLKETYGKTAYETGEKICEILRDLKKHRIDKLNFKDVLDTLNKITQEVLNNARNEDAKEIINTIDQIFWNTGNARELGTEVGYIEWKNAIQKAREITNYNDEEMQQIKNSYWVHVIGKENDHFSFYEKLDGNDKKSFADYIKKYIGSSWGITDDCYDLSLEQIKETPFWKAVEKMGLENLTIGGGG